MIFYVAGGDGVTYLFLELLEFLVLLRAVFLYLFLGLTTGIFDAFCPVYRRD